MSPEDLPPLSAVSVTSSWAPFIFCSLGTYTAYTSLCLWQLGWAWEEGPCRCTSLKGQYRELQLWHLWSWEADGLQLVGRDFQCNSASDHIITAPGCLSMKVCILCRTAGVAQNAICGDKFPTASRDEPVAIAQVGQFAVFRPGRCALL